MDQLLELVETGVGITEHKTRSYPLAIYYGEDDQPEVLHITNPNPTPVTIILITRYASATARLASYSDSN